MSMFVIGHRELEESHYMAPDQALLDLAAREEYEYSQTNVGNRRSAVRFGRNIRDVDAVNSTDFENDHIADVFKYNKVISKRYGSQPTTNLPIQV